MNKVHESLSSLLVDIDSLVPLAGNPRIGDVDAIAASLNEFGQLKPIVIRANGDGTSTIIAGNHTMQAARLLGWDSIAAVDVSEMDEKTAVTFALTDNRINELGSTDGSLLHAAISTVIDDYSDFFEVLGWDEFEMAAMDEQFTYYTPSESRETGYIAPVLINREDRQPAIQTTEKKTEPSHISAPDNVDSKEAITRGAVSIGQAGAKAVVQYTLVFDTSDQQRRWYDFVRWLRSDPGTEGDTTAERLIYFIEAHANF